MNYDLIGLIQHQIDSRSGETGRLEFILKKIKAGRPLYECDRKYLEIRLSNYTGRKVRLSEKDDVLVTEPQRDGKVEEWFGSYGAGQIPRSHTVSFSNRSDTDSESSMQKLRTIEEMRRDLHLMLIKLDQVEEKFQQEYGEVQYPTQREYAKYKESSSDRYHLSTENEMPKEKIKRINEGNKNLQKGTRELRVFAGLLFAVTITTIIILFTAITIFGMPTARQILDETYGISSDQIKTILNWIDLALVVILGVWSVFGLLYLRTTEQDQSAQA